MNRIIGMFCLKCCFCGDMIILKIPGKKVLFVVVFAVVLLVLAAVFAYRTYRFTKDAPDLPEPSEADCDVPFQEIADHLGFCSQFHFSREFARQSGLSPRAWRAARA